MKLDVLALAAHPDDAELACSGTLAKLIAQGKQVGVVDLTRGELGTRGTADLRDEEAAASKAILGLHVRENLRFRDGFFKNDEAHQLEVIRCIRRFRPEVLLINAPMDRHPDHGRASALGRESAFLSGLVKISTEWDGEVQKPWRPRKVFRYIQDHRLEPSFVVDISAHFDTKMASIKAFKSQFFDPDSSEPMTYIASEHFLLQVEARAREFGHLIGVEYGEGFIAERPLKVDDLLDLI